VARTLFPPFFGDIEIGFSFPPPSPSSMAEERPPPADGYQTAQRRLTSGRAGEEERLSMPSAGMGTCPLPPLFSHPGASQKRQQHFPPLLFFSAAQTQEDRPSFDSLFSPPLFSFRARGRSLPFFPIRGMKETDKVRAVPSPFYTASAGDSPSAAIRLPG